MATQRLGGFLDAFGRGYDEKALSLREGLYTMVVVTVGPRVDVPSSPSQPRVTDWNLRFSRAQCSGRFSSLPGASRCQPALLPSPWEPKCIGSPDLNIQPLAGVAVQLMGIRKHSIAMC